VVDFFSTVVTVAVKTRRKTSVFTHLRLFLEAYSLQVETLSSVENVVETAPRSTRCRTDGQYTAPGPERRRTSSGGKG